MNFERTASSGFGAMITIAIIRGIVILGAIQMLLPVFNKLVDKL